MRRPRGADSCALAALALLFLLGAGQAAAQTPTIVIGGSASSVTEGTSARFQVQASPTPSADLTVNLTVADASGSDFVAAGDEGDKTVTIPAGRSSAIYSVTTQNDSTDEPNGSVTVTVKTGTGYTVGEFSSASVTVNDNDDPPGPTITIAADTSPVTEGTAASFTVTADPAPSANLTVKLTVADASGSDFVAAGDEGDKTVTITAADTTASYSVTTQGDSTDEPNGSVTVTVKTGTGYTVGSANSASVTVNDDDEAANNPPVFSPTTASRAIDENPTATSTNVGAVIHAATDADNDTLTYTMAGTDADSFAFTASTRQITTKTGVTYDHETKSSYTVTIKADDSNGGTATLTVTISVNDVNEPPSAPSAPTVTSASLTSVNVSWTAPTNTGKPDINDYDVRYFAGSADPANESEWSTHSFSSTGTSTTITGLTAGTTYRVQVRATNAEGTGDWSASGSGATNANQAPVFSPATASRAIDENPEASTNVGAVIHAATDADNDTLTYTMAGTDADSFAFTASTRQITTKTGVTYDHETKSSYTVTIKADDSNGGTATLTVTISVNDVNEPPSAPGAPTVTAGATGTSAASVSVSWTAPTNTGKPDINDYDVRYFAGSADPANESEWTTHSFSGTDTSTTITGLTAGTTYRVQVRATNAEGTGDWSASGSGATKNAPVFTNQPTTASVDENSNNGTAVKTITATDADTGDTITYSLDSTSDKVFNISSSGAITVQVDSGSSLDHEATSSYTATVTASDGTNTATHDVTISVTDVDEPPSAPGAPTVTGASSTSVNVSWTAPTNTGKPAINDYDVQYKLSTVTNWTNHNFASAGTSTTISSLTPNTTYNVQVKAKNPEGPSDWSATGSGATNPNQAPVFTGQDTTASVAENSAGDTAVETITATDPDGDTITYSLDSASDAVFDIGSSSGAITVQSGADLNFEGTKSYTATVTATDSWNATATHNVTISVTDVNEPPDAPNAPTVSMLSVGEQARPVSLNVNWTAPAVTGRPAINDYDVQYKKSSATAWTSHSHTGTGTSTTIGSLANRLEPGTQYDVQVRAANEEGPGAWSATGNGTTGPPDTTAPTFSSASVNRTALQVVFDENLDSGFNSTPRSGAFNVQVDNERVELGAAVSISGKTVSLTLNTAAAHGATVTVAYTQPTGSFPKPLQDPFSNKVQTFSAQSVTNNTPTGSDTTAPGFSSATVNGRELKVVFNENLDTNSTPAGSAFSANLRFFTANREVIRGMGTASISDSTVTVTLTKAVPAGEEIHVSYSTPTTNKLQDAASNLVPNFSGKRAQNLAPTVPVFATETVTRTVEENTAAPGNVGAPVMATDADGDTLTYSLAGTSAEFFAIGAGTGQITVGSATTLDFEATSRYNVTVHVTDGEDTDGVEEVTPGIDDTITVTINVRDVNEPPPAPDAPTVNVVSTSSLEVSWTAPAATADRPPVTGYDVQYQVSGAAAWTDHPHEGLGTTTRIGELRAGTTYEVQVRAKNDEGPSDWSPTGSDTTTTPDPSNTAPVFTNQPSTAEVTEDSVAGTPVVTITATDVDSDDTITYSLDNAAAAVFDIDSSGNITVGSNATLDHETTPSYTATVTASDGTDSATHEVTISVDDVDEPPDAPDAPAVTGASATSVDVTWTAPDVTGKPPITDYDVQYRASDDADWTDAGYDGVATATTISSLTEGTTYEVQVLAKNDEGPSDWSATGIGTANRPPVTTDDPIPVGETMYVAGDHQVTVRREPGTPEVRLALPGPVSGDLAVTVKPVAPDVPLEPETFRLGPTGARTVVDVAVDSVPATGLVLCLPVTPAVRQAAADQLLVLLHYVNGRWTEVPGSALDSTADRVCATITAFSPFAVGYRVGGVPPTDELPPVEVLLSLALNRVQEGLNLALTVNLSAAPRRTVTVPLVATPGTATPDDYAVSSLSVTFGPDETTKTVIVSALADARWDEPDETVRFAVGADLPAQVTAGARAETEVTIENRTRQTAAVQAWTARFGRTAATHVTDAVGDRLRATPDQASHFTIGGYRLPVGRRPVHEATPPADATPGAGHRGTGIEPAGSAAGARPAEESTATTVLTEMARVLGIGPGAGSAPDTPWAEPPDPRLGQSQSLRLPAFRLRDVLQGSSFRLALGRDEADSSHPRLTAWGRFAGTTFAGQDGALAVDGDVFTGTVGVDGTWDRWLGGLAVAHSRGDGSYTMPLADGGRDEGDLEQTLTSLHPYMRYAVTDRLDVWGLVGYGWGELDVELDSGVTLETDTNLVMGAFGGRGIVLAPEDTGGFQLATRTDAMLTRTSTEAGPGVDATDADAHRVRLILEGSRGYTWEDGQRLTPTVELGLRHDWGDAETGFGLEVGSRVSYAHPGLGLTVEAAVRGLLAHEDDAYDEWGASGTVRVAPGAGGQGLNLTLAPAWGATASGVEGLWSRQTTQGLAPTGSRPTQTGRLQAEVGYGLALFDTGLLTPYAGTVLADGADRTYRLGARWAGGTGWQVHLEGTRQEPSGPQPVNQGVQVQATWGF